MLWKEIIEKSQERNEEPHQTFREELQKTILTTLSHLQLFNHIVFQGGTALRLFYGNPRLSEDLDFVQINKEEKTDLTPYTPRIKTDLQTIYPFLEDIKIRIQRRNMEIQRLIITTISDIIDQKIRIHIELAYIPSYYNKPRILYYPPLNPVVRVEEKEEILVDKIIAIVNRPYIKGRDLWDINFLTEDKKIIYPKEILLRKLGDYKLSTIEFNEKNTLRIKDIRNKGIETLSEEMHRFLPKHVFDQYKEYFPEMIEKIIGILEGIKL